MGYMGFKALEGSLEGKVRNPGAVAASIGRKKYGKAKFQKAAAAGKTMEGEKPVKKAPVPEKPASKPKHKSKGHALFAGYGR